MSVHKKTPKIKTGDSTAINPTLFKELESLIQDLKNNQRCFAEAAALVNSSQLRNLFEKIELERTIFMGVIAKAIERTDLISGGRSYNVNVAWFSSIIVNEVSKDQFDFEVLERCIQCEETTYQFYELIMDLRAKEKIFIFLDKQKSSLDRTAQQLKSLHLNLETLLIQASKQV